MTQPPTSEPLGRQLDWQTAEIEAACNLADNELHLWLLPLKLDATQQTDALALLNDIQRDKYHRRATPQLQKAYLAGRYYLFHLLANYAGLPISELKLSLTRLNKPYLNPNPKNIEFNFSDCLIESGHVGLYGFCKHRAVGVDIEPLARTSNFDAIAERRFSEAELNYVRLPDGNIDAQRFLSYWTRKEALGKATGQGINYAMREMDLASAGEFELDFCANNKDKTPFRLEQIQINGQLIACVVHANHQALNIKAFRLAE